MKKILLIIAFISCIGAVIFAASGTFKQKPEQSKSRLSIATSFYPLYYFTKEIAQEYADVENLTPAGAEPHDYELTSGDMVRVQNSDILFILGSELEAWGTKVRDLLDEERTALIAVGEQIADQTIIEDGIILRDPHIWLSPKRAKKMAQTIEKALIQYDPAHATEYKENMSWLERRLNGLDSSYTALLSSCTQKDFITSHAAFGYLAREYGLNQVAIAGVSPDEEPSPKEIARIAEYVKQKNIKIIFFETLVSPKFAETIAQETGAKTLALNPLEGLYKDEIKQGKNYFTEMEENLNNLHEALQCK